VLGRDVAGLGVDEAPDLIALDPELRLRRVTSWYSAQARPSSTNNPVIVFRAAPVIRDELRIELPSTRHRMTCARSARLNLFILLLCVTAVTTVCHERCTEAPRS